MEVHNVQGRVDGEEEILEATERRPGIISSVVEMVPEQSDPSDTGSIVLGYN